MNRKMVKTLILMISILVIFGIVGIVGINSGAGNQLNNFSIRGQVVYESFVDASGFYKVLNVPSNKMVSYKNKTLNIYKGDKITWVNDDPAEKRLTVISSQKLWKSEDGVLGGKGKELSYTFNKSGAYMVYIKEYPGIQSQKIIVSQIGKTGNISKVSVVKNGTVKKSTTKKNAVNVSTIKSSIAKKNTVNNSTKNIITSDKAAPGNSMIMTMTAFISLATLFRYKKR